jgi:hypothetical protein
LSDDGDDDNDCTVVTRDTAERVPVLFCPCSIQEAADVGGAVKGGLLFSFFLTLLLML